MCLCNVADNITLRIRRKVQFLKVFLWRLIPTRNTYWYSCFPVALEDSGLTKTLGMHLTVRFKSLRNTLHQLLNMGGVMGEGCLLDLLSLSQDTNNGKWNILPIRICYLCSSLVLAWVIFCRRHCETCKHPFFFFFLPLAPIHCCWWTDNIKLRDATGKIHVAFQWLSYILWGALRVNRELLLSPRTRIGTFNALLALFLSWLDRH